MMTQHDRIMIYGPKADGTYMPAKKTIQNEELAARGNAPRRFIRQREPRPSVACKGACPRAGSREPLWVGFRGVHFGKHTGEVNCFSRNVRHEQPRRACAPGTAGSPPPRFGGSRSPVPRLRPSKLDHTWNIGLTRSLPSPVLPEGGNHEARFDRGASVRAFTPVFDGLWTRVNALKARLLSMRASTPLPFGRTKPTSRHPVVPARGTPATLASRGPRKRGPMITAGGYG